MVLLDEVVAEGAEVLDFGDVVIADIDGFQRDRVFTFLSSLATLFLFLLFVKKLHELKLVQALPQVRIVPILDSIIGTTLHLLSDITPAIAMDQVKLHDEQVFFHSPLALADVWVQVVMPPLATLLANATRQALGHVSPVSCARRRDNFSQDLVFLLSPRALGKVTAVVELEPSRVALDLRFAWEELADAIPTILTESVHVAHEFLVLSKQRAGAVRYVREVVTMNDLILTSAWVHWMQYLGCFLRLCWLA